jgi:hypothetical protein
MAEYLRENAKPIAKLEKLADELIETMKQSLVSFFAVCEAARDLDKKAVRHVLREKKFDESRISEILRVAHSTPEIWEQYKTKAIGFKLALKKARDDDGDKGPKRQQSERKRFCEDMRRVLEEYIPVAGPLPKYIEASAEMGEPKLSVVLPEIRVHGYTLKVDAVLTVREKK